MKIYLIRHGETDLNAKGLLQGWVDEPLNQNGRRLAVLTGRAMKGIHFDDAISSPLKRAKETAEIVLRESGNRVRVTTDDRIKEINCGTLEGKPISVMGEAGRLHYEDPFHFAGFPGGENILDVCERTQQFFKELIMRDDGKTYLIGIHGCALRAILNPLYGDPTDFWQERVPYNCCVSIVEAKKGTARLIEADKIYYDERMIVDRYRMFL